MTYRATDLDEDEVRALLSAEFGADITGRALTLATPVSMGLDGVARSSRFLLTYHYFSDSYDLIIR